MILNGCSGITNPKVCKNKHGAPIFATSHASLVGATRVRSSSSSSGGIQAYSC